VAVRIWPSSLTRRINSNVVDNDHETITIASNFSPVG